MRTKHSVAAHLCRWRLWFVFYRRRIWIDGSSSLWSDDLVGHLSPRHKSPARRPFLPIGRQVRYMEGRGQCGRTRVTLASGRSTCRATIQDYMRISACSMLTADDGRTATASCSSECTLRSTCSGQSHAKWKRPRSRCTSGNGNLTSPAARVACFWWTQPVQYWFFFCHENSGVVLYFYNYLQFL
jgi:hypothetical protein